MLRSLRRTGKAGGGRFGLTKRLPASLRLVALILPVMVGAGFAEAAIFTDQIGPYHKTSAKPVPVADPALYQEYGFQEAEQADFAAPAGRFHVTGWRFSDSTGAMAFQQFLGNKTTITHGNYVFQFTGGEPAQDDLEAFYLDLPKFETSPLPVLPTYLPRQSLISGSERYILGPVSLERFFPLVSPSVAAFHLGTEAQAGQFDTPKGPLNLAIFNYPTPAIAMERYKEFQKIPGALAKRAGPMVAVTIQPPDADAAERLLAQVRYNVNLTWNEYLGGPTVRDSAKMIMVIVALAGIIIALCLAAGVGFGAFRIILRKMGWQGPEADKMIVLDLGDK
ncbi:MAG TPA: hypothetical protein VKV74_13915 [Bryobacteraceae bacterium]|nr:hypothetical protein [Bryobacteraceae bacterium]